MKKLKVYTIDEVEIHRNCRVVPMYLESDNKAQETLFSGNELLRILNHEGSDTLGAIQFLKEHDSNKFRIKPYSFMNSEFTRTRYVIFKN